MVAVLSQNQVVFNNNDNEFILWLKQLKQMPYAESARVVLGLDQAQGRQAVNALSEERLYHMCSTCPLAEKLQLLRLADTELREQTIMMLSPKLQFLLTESLICDSPVVEVMESTFPVLPASVRVKQALDVIRKDEDNRFSFGVCYLQDEQGKLIGQLCLQQLLHADPNTLLEGLMAPIKHACMFTLDQEDAAMLLQKKQSQLLPVIDADGGLLGILTASRALSILKQEQTEDMEHFMGITGDSGQVTYMNTSVSDHVKNRIGWIIGLALMGILSGLVIHQYESAIEALMILAIYMPMVADTGGNTGSQSATLVVRALALGELRIRQFMSVIWKEFRVALIIALALGVITFAKVAFLSWDVELPGGFSLQLVAATISIALMLQVISATVIGAVLPLVATALKKDPAIVASPAITTVVDITGMLIYFFTATTILGI